MMLPDGWKFTPIYTHCPSCGYELSEKIKHPKADKGDPNHIEEHTVGLVIPRVPGKDATGVISGVSHELGSQRVIYPLSEPDKKQACGNRSSRNSWIRLKQSSTSKKKEERQSSRPPSERDTSNPEQV
jgi:hypothetical protein